MTDSTINQLEQNNIQERVATDVFTFQEGVDLEKMQTLAKVGLHFGHKKTNWNPKMEQYIYALRNGVYIIDLAKTAELLEKAKILLKGIVKEGGKILFVGTTAVSEIVAKEIAQALNMPFVSGRWLGGTLTNFSTISKRLDYLRDMEAKEKAGEFSKYTKKEQLNFSKEINDLREKFGGIKNLKKLPEILFSFSAHADKLSIREAKRRGIPIIGIVDTNADPTAVDYSIPANDDSIKGLRFIAQEITDALTSL